MPSTPSLDVWSQRIVLVFTGSMFRFILLGFSFLLAACAGSRPDAMPEATTNVDQIEESKETVVLRPPTLESGDYAYDLAPVDTVRVIRADDQLRAFVKGAFPDGCWELHDLEQASDGGILDATLRMRRPKSAVCTQAIRPYRFYFELDGSYPAGSYTLRLNGQRVEFSG